MHGLFHSLRKKKRLVFFISLVFFGLVAGFAYSLAKDIPRVNRISERAVVESTKIYDRTGKVLLYEIHGEEKRTVIPLAEIPENVKWATIVGEDFNFYRHIGLDGKGILRALFVNLSRGDITQGGSTITQQLVKKALLTDDRTFTRKIKEALLALLVEKRYSKDEILELYLNQIPYGTNAYGIEAAAQTFFEKPARDLTLAESALLAALPKAPTRYSPYGSHKEELLARRNSILERMAGAGFAGKDAAAEAQNTPISVAPPRQSIRAPHFVLFVKEYLSERYGEDFIEQGGLKVITTLDWKLQEEAEKIVREGAEENEKLVRAYNASLVAVDPKTGDIVTMVGSRDYWSDPKPDGCKPGIDCKFDPHVNVTTRSRQPGSALKPFVYATAFKKGYTPETVLFDAFTEFNVNCNPDGTPGPFGRMCYHPRNYDGKFRGPVSLRQSLAQSLNVPSVKMLYLAGAKDSIETARTMGISTLTDPERYGLTLVLGGAEVTLLEMASAYGVFAQDGVLHPKNSILRVETSRGVVLEEKRDVALPVIDTNIARIINNILSDNDARVPMFSPRSSLYFPNRQVAAKTGTTQDFHDAWVIGYTPSLVAGVWVGNNDNTPMSQAAVSIMVAGPIWHKFIETALHNTPPENFASFERQYAAKPVLRGFYRSGPYVKIDKISGKLAGEYTPAELVEERGFGEVKTILSLLRKDDPLGEAPAEARADPQFKNWQQGIERWLLSNQLLAAEAPKELDDLHLPEKKPKLELILPAPGSRDISNISVKIQSTFPLREVSLFVNDELRGSKTAPIVSDMITFPLGNKLPSGAWNIKITAYDAVGNKESLAREIQIPQ